LFFSGRRTLSVHISMWKLLENGRGKSYRFAAACGVWMTVERLCGRITVALLPQATRGQHAGIVGTQVATVDA